MAEITWFVQLREEKTKVQPQCCLQHLHKVVERQAMISSLVTSNRTRGTGCVMVELGWILGKSPSQKGWSSTGKGSSQGSGQSTKPV